jgi:branched-chain amino acid transport system substrate-binding protein
MVVQYIMRNHRPGNGRLGILRDRTPGFNSVVEAVQREAEAAGLEVHVRQHQNGPSDAQWITTNQIEVVFPIMAPSQFVQIVRSPGGAAPQYVGVGITMGLNTVASAACQGGNPYKGMFLSPFPGLNQIDRLDADFRRAGGTGDIELALWGLNKTVHVIFQQMGQDNLTREAFVHTLQTQPIETNVYPELRHTAEDHFRAQSAHVLIANCGASPPQYETPNDGLFVSGF